MERVHQVVHDGSRLGLSADALRVHFEHAIMQFYPECQWQREKL
ncbi:hypothetical protein [Ktedonosporobacter rubrisoli]|nr:hypothetical protein [Ktedonosporobacter rubrisoli]